MIPVRHNGKMGCINRESKFVILPEFDEIHTPLNGVANAKRDGKWGTVTQLGAWLIKPRFDEISDFDECGIAAARFGDNWRLITFDGSSISRRNFHSLYCAGSGLYVGTTETQSWIFTADNRQEFKIESRWVYCNGDLRRIVIYDSSIEAYRFISLAASIRSANWVFNQASTYSNGYALVQKNGVWCYIDYEGSMIGCEINYEQIKSFSCGLAGFQVSNRWGFLSTPLQIAIPAQFDYVGSFSNCVCPCMLNGKWGYIDLIGHWLVEPVYDDLSPLINGRYGYAVLGSRRLVITGHGEVIFEQS